MSQTYTAVIKEDDGWWIGWIEEVPGVNSQGETREELMENLRSALQDMLDLNREEARAAAQGNFVEESIAL
jgi:predicted RNase H-like HicB family nuclease